MRAYWFSRKDGTTDHQVTPAEIGRTDTVDGEIIPCERGLHASPNPFDALQYACGPVLWEVEIADDSTPHGEPVDKYASSTRKYLRKADLTLVCRKFAAQQAFSVSHFWDAKEIVLAYLKDEANGKDRSDIRPNVRTIASAASDAASAAYLDAAAAAYSAASYFDAVSAARAASIRASAASADFASKERFNNLAIQELALCALE